MTFSPLRRAALCAAAIAAVSALAAARPALAASDTDWPNLARYKDEDAKLPPPTPGEPRVVFMGDSITDGWGRHVGEFFPGKPYINRGISGQTTPQMLVRFRQDVVALKPKVVVINAGINDIAGNTGPTTLEAIENNLMSMSDLARFNGIGVVLASVTPARAFGWRKGVDPRDDIRALNAWMKEYAAKNRLVYCDYYSAMVDADGGMREGLSSDGVHPTAAGYAIMGPLAQAAINRALGQTAERVRPVIM